ncbi:MAG: TetM/TetW/TetO/TetS family tetracycline resistance ribosomal protection protein [Hamadaea sp.]|nr:TetM/TetW/TetO/TetS family tetracycline resistance ribosomal protection protein [Hamadaea sp.]
MRTLNLGILAHVDAGKTSLTERLLHAAGVIDAVGSVDEGSTQTDALALERRRGITIKSAVVSFTVGGTIVNLIDTPGHPDFIAEVERVLSVLDGAVLVVSAVEGVQAQTRVLWRALRRLGIPTILFVNKVDRAGADPDRVTVAIAAKLSADLVPVTAVIDAGGAAAAVADQDPHRWLDVLTRHDDRLLSAYLEQESGIGDRRLTRSLNALARAGRVFPVLAGSAITGTGVTELLQRLPQLLPGTERDVDAAVTGSVFKVERGPAGERVALAHLTAGTVRVRDKILVAGRQQKVTGLSVYDNGTAKQEQNVTAGRIARLTGLADVRIGDPIGDATARDQHHFAPPTLETVVDAARTADRAAMYAALTDLAEQDPLIGLRRDEVRQEISVSLYGEVQKEVIGAMLAEEYGVEVTFRETTTLCIERPLGRGEAVEIIAKGANPFLATVGLRIEPGPVGSGVHYRLGVELGSMPYAFFVATEETVRETLRQGLLGWEVTDVVVTMTHSGYWARQSHAHGSFDKSMSSTAGDFRNLTPLVLMEALRQAGTAVLEPMHAFELETPGDTVAGLMPVLNRAGAVLHSSAVRGSVVVLEGLIPAARVHGLERQLPGLTGGEGVLETAFDHYEPVRGEAPQRARTDHNPLHRKEYLLHVVRRV